MSLEWSSLIGFLKIEESQIRLKYSSVPNRSAGTLINIEETFQPHQS